MKLTPKSIGLPGEWGVQDEFPWSIAALGDLDGDGVPDIAVSAGRADRGGTDRGAVWILFMRSDGSVKSFQEISSVAGNFRGELRDFDHFGVEVEGLGDVDGDGIFDLAVSSIRTDSITFGFPPPWNEADLGTVWLLFLNRDGSVKRHEVVERQGLLPEVPPLVGASFGGSLTTLGDLDGDGISEIGVTESVFEDAIFGSAWILFLDAEGSVRYYNAISPRSGDIGRENANVGFPKEISSIGDLDGDGVDDAVLGGRGNAVLMFMKADGGVDTYANVEVPPSWLPTGLWGTWTRDHFATSLAPLGDLDRNGVVDLAFGLEHDSDVRRGAGALGLLFLNKDGGVDWHAKISDGSELLRGKLDANDWFGDEVQNIGDLNHDGLPEIAVSAPGDDDDGGNTGALWILFDLTTLESDAQVVTDLPPFVPDDDQSLQITTRIAGIGGIASAELAYRPSGAREFAIANMAETGPGLFSQSIPHFLADDRGLEFYYSATNGYGHVTRQPSAGVVAIPVRVAQVLFRPRTDKVYELVAFPFELEDRSARAIFEDDLGDYDPARWRFFAQSSRDPVELDEAVISIDPGRAYWLLTDGSVSAIDAGAGVTIPTDHSFAIPIRPGWNLVGNPFNFSVSVQNLSTRLNQLVDIRSFDGDWTSEVDHLAPFTGYAVYSEAAELDTLLIDPDASRDSEEITTKPSPDEAKWTIQIIGEGALSRDADNFAGVVPHASKTWDDFDRPEPPTVGDYVSVYFPHDEWARSSNRFNVDLRPLDGENFVWPVEIAAKDSGHVDLTFAVGDVPAEYGVELVDDVFGVSQDLRTNNTYSVITEGDGSPVQLELRVGKDALGAGAGPEVPTREVSVSAFPNPTVGTTHVAYHLTSDSNVTIHVFDILGRMVASIIDDVPQQSGRYTRIWNGLDSSGHFVPSGTYIVQVSYGAESATVPVTVVGN